MKRANEASEPLEQEMMGQGGVQRTAAAVAGADLAELRARRERPQRNPKYLCC